MIKKLIDTAISYQKNSYSPYSNFKVGAAVLCSNGKIYGGCNIEIASFSPTICAERTAIFKAISEENTKIEKIAIVGDNDWTYPCGVCRQVIREFSTDDFEIIIIKDKNNYRTHTLEELLPYSFGPEDL